jgi:hypothetical protein
MSYELLIFAVLLLLLLLCCLVFVFFLITLLGCFFIRKQNKSVGSGECGGQPGSVLPPPRPPPPPPPAPNVPPVTSHCSHLHLHTSLFSFLSPLRGRVRPRPCGLWAVGGTRFFPIATTHSGWLHWWCARESPFLRLTVQNVPPLQHGTPSPRSFIVFHYMSVFQCRPFYSILWPFTRTSRALILAEDPIVKAVPMSDMAAVCLEKLFRVNHILCADRALLWDLDLSLCDSLVYLDRFCALCVFVLL